MLNVDKNWNYIMLECMTTVVDNLLKSVTIKNCIEKKIYTIIGCMYRAPRYSTETFRDWREEMFSKVSRKVLFHLWGFQY